MPASTLLRAYLIGLVFVCIVFVQLTGAAGLSWLLPLYALTLLAPLLSPLREKLVYRGLWNAAVLGVFALLVHHATGNNLRYVLEGGLVLAALCQVHLLNNLRARQRPDLLFLNSILIAIVTGFLSQDLNYAIAFLVYAPLFVLALQLRCLGERGATLSGPLTRRLVTDGLVRSGWLLSCTLLVFLLWPRDFGRKGFVTGRLNFSSPSDDSEVRFADRLSLKRGGRTRASDRVVMTARLLAGSPADVPALWRGATLSATNGREWWPLEPSYLAAEVGDPDPWRRREASRVLEREGAALGPRLLVTVTDTGVDRLFAPLDARRVAIGREGAADAVIADIDGTLRLRDSERAGPRLPYEVVLGLQDEVGFGGPIPASPPDALAPYVVLPRTERLQSASELAATLSARLADGAEQHQVVSAFSDHLRTRYQYLPPGDPGSVESLEEFLEGDSGGHCEFFAAALTAMLRSEGIPCRIATGYRSSEWDYASGVLTFRSRDAHAWVEVFDPDAGWYAVDPVPLSIAEGGEGLWQTLQTTVASAWSRLTGFDAEGRVALMGWMRAQPGRAWEALRSNPGSSALFLAGVLLILVLLRVRSRRGAEASVRSYRDALRRAGLRLEPGETPRELMVRARVSELPQTRLEALRQATGDHERSRYAA